MATVVSAGIGSIAGCSLGGDRPAEGEPGAAWDPKPGAYRSFNEWLPALEEGEYDRLWAIDLEGLRAVWDTADPMLTEWAHVAGTHDYFGARYADLSTAIYVELSRTEFGVGDLTAMVYPGSIDREHVHDLLFPNGYAFEEHGSIGVYTPAAPTSRNWRGIAVGDRGVAVFEQKNVPALQALFAAAAGDRERSSVIGERWRSYTDAHDTPLVTTWPEPYVRWVLPEELRTAPLPVRPGILAWSHEEGHRVETVHVPTGPGDRYSVDELVEVLDSRTYTRADTDDVSVEAAGSDAIDVRFRFPADEPTADSEPAVATIRAHGYEGQLLLKNVAGEPFPADRLRLFDVEHDESQVLDRGAIEPGTEIRVDVTDLIGDGRGSIRVHYRMDELFDGEGWELAETDLIITD